MDEKRESQESGVVTLCMLSSLRGYTQVPMEVTEKNKSLVDKWLDRETNSIYCLEMFRQGEPQYYYATKEVFNTIKSQLDTI